MAGGPVQRVLLVTLSNIGDAVLTTPVLEHLHGLYPAAAIDIAADTRSSALFEHCPYRGEILSRRKGSGWRETLALIRRLRRVRYDLVVDLRTDGLAYLLRARRRCTKDGAATGHTVERHLRALAALGPGPAAPATRLWLGEEDRRWAAAALGDAPAQRWLALAPGANWPPKIWPAASFAALAGTVREHFDAVALLGGPSDRERAEMVAANAALPCVDLCGRSSLLQAAAVLERCRVLVGNDSGLGHMASAVGTPTLTVFGPGQPGRYHPWGPWARWVVAPEQSLERLAPEVVVEQLLTLLESLP